VVPFTSPSPAKLVLFQPASDLPSKRGVASSFFSAAGLGSSASAALALRNRSENARENMRVMG